MRQTRGVFPQILERFELSNRRYALLKKGDAVVVGVSGGPDSTALFLLLCKLQRKYALRLSVAHLDHGLQRENRIARALVKKMADSHCVPFYSKKVDVRRRALREKLSLEDAGRRERYRFFEAVAGKTRSNKIATAHTLDDQAETMLMRLLRGCGMRGLVGIPYKRKQGRVEVIRPVLDCSKTDLIFFLKSENLSFVQDKMNDNPVFLRSRIRHQLLPLLRRRFNPQIKQVLAALQSICVETQGYLQQQAKSAFRNCCVSLGQQKIVLDVCRLKALHPVIRYETLAACIIRLKGGIAGFGYAHWAAVDTILFSEEKNLQTHWPHHVHVKRAADRLMIDAHRR